MPAVADLVDGRTYFNMNVWSSLSGLGRFPKLLVRMGGILDAELPGVLQPISPPAN